jgi:AcrR family transcriptional regulator
VTDRRAERHLATRRRIVDVAWSLARDRGLAGLALRDVADVVGMRTPSLYVYFDSKNAVYDAMFADGYRALLAGIDQTSTEGEPAEVLRRAAHLFFDFAVADPARYQLLFLRTIPGFVPTEESYLLAQAVIERLGEVLRAAGADSREEIDLWTAMFTGLASQQISNDPGGDRWERLIDHAVGVLLQASSRP